MIDVTLGLAILLGVGFLAAKLGQLLRLPSVTGYIFAGLLLGPSGLSVITEEVIATRLGHFSQIALMLIAFGIGEHLELKRLRYTARNVIWIGLADIVGAFCLVSVGTFFMARFADIGGGDWWATDFVVLAMLLGAVSIATAPASILHVMREIRASGRFSTTLLQVVAVDNGLAIMTFGIVVSMARHMLGAGSGMIISALASSLSEIVTSLLMGIITGLLIDFLFRRLHRRDEMLTAGLALLLFCGETARLLELSPLLAGMAAGFTIVNQDRRDVRLFRVLNAFEGPIFVLFFTLAGAHVHLSTLAVAGWVGLAYFLLRSAGKIAGAHLGARLIHAPVAMQRYLGVALMPQAGVAIGLIFLIKGDQDLSMFSSVITPIVLAGVFLAELAGPVCTRFALQKAGEGSERSQTGVAAPGEPVESAEQEGIGAVAGVGQGVRLIPWTWGRLRQSAEPKGTVVFGASHIDTVAGLARMATLLAHYQSASPMAVRVEVAKMDPDRCELLRKKVPHMFGLEAAEVKRLGYELETVAVRAADVASGLVSVACQSKARGIILGHPLQGTAQGFQKVVEAVAREAPCQVVVVRFAGALHTERILVPILSMDELDIVRDVVCSLSAVGQHRLRLLRLMPSDAKKKELYEAENRLYAWTRKQGLTPQVRCLALPSDSRLEEIVKVAAQYDLLVMAATQIHGLHRLFFGSLAEDVAQKCRKPMLMVYAPPK